MSEPRRDDETLTEFTVRLVETEWPFTLQLIKAEWLVAERTRILDGINEIEDIDWALGSAYDQVIAIVNGGGPDA